MPKSPPVEKYSGYAFGSRYVDLRDIPPPRPDPIPGLGAPEIAGPIWGNPFKWLRRKKSKDGVDAS
jgi:hypothetical protein